MSEADAVAAMVDVLAAAPRTKLWCPKGRWKEGVPIRFETCFDAVKTYDLAWTCDAHSIVPSHRCQAKLGVKEQVDQEVLLYLGDLTYAALDHKIDRIATFTAAFVHRCAAKEHWRKLAEMTGTVTMVLEPTRATDAVARGSSWLDVPRCSISPTTRSQYNKLFGGGTNAKFVGLWRRVGRATITARPHMSVHGDWTVIEHEPLDIRFEGSTMPLEDWWP